MNGRRDFAQEDKLVMRDDKLRFMISLLMYNTLVSFRSIIPKYAPFHFVHLLLLFA